MAGAAGSITVLVRLCFAAVLVVATLSPVVSFHGSFHWRTPATLHAGCVACSEVCEYQECESKHTYFFAFEKPNFRA